MSENNERAITRAEMEICLSLEIMLSGWLMNQGGILENSSPDFIDRIRAMSDQVRMRICAYHRQQIEGGKEEVLPKTSIELHFQLARWLGVGEEVDSDIKLLPSDVLKEVWNLANDAWMHGKRYIDPSAKL